MENVKQVQTECYIVSTTQDSIQTTTIPVYITYETINKELKPFISIDNLNENKTFHSTSTDDLLSTHEIEIRWKQNYVEVTPEIVLSSFIMDWNKVQDKLTAPCNKDYIYHVHDVSYEEDNIYVVVEMERIVEGKRGIQEVSYYVSLFKIYF